MKKIRSIVAGLMLLGGAAAVVSVSVHQQPAQSVAGKHIQLDQMQADTGGGRGGGGLVTPGNG